MGGWVGGRANLRIAYSNQKLKTVLLISVRFTGTWDHKCLKTGGKLGKLVRF